MNNPVTGVISTIRRIVVAVFLGFVVLAAGGAVITLLRINPESPDTAPWLGAFSMHTTMLVVSVLLMIALSRGKMSKYGFTQTGTEGLKNAMLWSLGVGTAAAAIQATLLPLDIPIVERFTFVQIVIFIWIYASICEEILMRGLIQGYLAPLRELGVRVFGIRLSLPVIVSALFFALIHLPAVGAETGGLAQLFFLSSAAVLGLMAGYYREKTESLLPAVLVHMMFNVSGSLVDLVATG